MQKKVSLTDLEKEFLSSFLIDKRRNSHKAKAGDWCEQKEAHEKGSLTKDMLFENPFAKAGETMNIRQGPSVDIEDQPSSFQQKKEENTRSEHENAREVVVVPSRVKRLSVFLGKNLSRRQKQMRTSDNRSQPEENITSEERDECSNRWSDLSRKNGKNCATSFSSWDYNEGGFEHYDTWDVLRDEYAQDFGYNFARSDNSDSDEDIDEHFAILGTSQDDNSSKPHVLSPPIMSSLLNFIPGKLSGENYWLKYSLIRDGASLETLYRYNRAATNTIVAIQTIDGDTVGSIITIFVLDAMYPQKYLDAMFSCIQFGSFTSSPWRITKGYFGSGESFLWKLRHNRNTPCHSLFDQAHLESEIDVFPFSRLNSCVQLCTQNEIAIGSGEISHKDTKISDASTNTKGIKHVDCGFGFALQSNLQYGTTSPCATFCNPSLIHEGSVFEVSNLEVWTFTPYCTINEAEKLEMKKYFMEGLQSPLNTSLADTGRYSHSLRQNSVPAGFLSTENQQAFYRRIGQDELHDYQRTPTI